MIDSQRLAEAEQAAAAPFTLDGAVIDAGPRNPKIVYSSRLPAEYSDDIAAVARENNTTPSQAVAILVGEALEARKQPSVERSGDSPGNQSARGESGMIDA